VAVFGLLETPAEVSGQGYEASSDTGSARGRCASALSDQSVNRTTSSDSSQFGYCTEINYSLLQLSCTRTIVARNNRINAFTDEKANQNYSTHIKRHEL